MSNKFAYFAGGCFWCITPLFKIQDGVIDVRSGYSGGDEPNPCYEEVKSQKTGHRETIKIEYDETKISYEFLLRGFLDGVDIHDGEGQYIDRGHSYTLAVYYDTDEEKAIIDRVLSEYDEEIFVSVERFKFFCEAEEYHQDYYLKHPKEFEEELINSGRKQSKLK